MAATRDDTPLGRAITRRGIKVRDLSDATGIDLWRLNDYIHMRTRPDPVSLAKLCHAIGCQPHDIYTPAVHAIVDQQKLRMARRRRQARGLIP